MLRRPIETAPFIGTWPDWAGGWDHFDSYPRLSLLSKLVLSRQMYDLMPGHPIDQISFVLREKVRTATILGIEKPSRVN